MTGFDWDRLSGVLPDNTFYLRINIREFRMNVGRRLLGKRNSSLCPALFVSLSHRLQHDFEGSGPFVQGLERDAFPKRRSLAALTSCSRSATSTRHVISLKSISQRLIPTR